jgi:hypothetical protein
LSQTWSQELTPVVEGQTRQHFEIRPTDAEIQIDGSLDEAAWSAATMVPLTHEWSPGDNTEPPVRTECLITFDSANLYVAFRAHDPDPSQIRAHLADRDTAFLDDTVGFYLDTFNDQRRAFEFRINPLGVQMEATVNDIDATEDWSWNAIWASAGRITAEGYVVEVAVPFRQLRFSRTAEVQTWGFLAMRSYPRSVAHEIRSTANLRNQDCTVCQFDRLTGFQGIETGHNLETVPTVTAGRTDARLRLDTPLLEGGEDAEAGLSVRWGITPNVTLNATVNPDFSQVEADAAELDVNERFALFFPEKRPFFLEGADFFETPLDAVFTRTVADPAFGFKLTGKEGRNAFGIFLAEDRLNNLLFPSAEGSGLGAVEQDVRSGVVRYRRDIGRVSTLGVLYAGRQADGYSNQVYGLDGSLRLTASDTVRFQAVNSETEYPGEVALLIGQPVQPFDGAAYTATYSHGTRNWSWLASYDQRAAGFRADSGFIPQVDFRDRAGAVQRTFWGKPGGWYSRFIVNVNSSRKEDLADGRLLEQDANLMLQYEGPLQSVVRVRLLPNRESYLGVTYDNYRNDLLLALRPTGDFYAELFLRNGETIDFVNARQADFTLVQPRVEFKLGRRASGELQHAWQDFEVRGERFLLANLTQTTLRYHLNIRTFFRAILQYRDVERDLALHNPGIRLEPEEERLFSQLLFSYKLNPQTVVLLGYSDLHEATGLVDELTQRNRSFFLKLGYAWLW